MRGRSLMLLMVAVGCGLATMYGVMQLQGSRPEEAQILVADRDLNPEETIKEDMVRLTKVPRASVPPGSFSKPPAGARPLADDQDPGRRAPGRGQARRQGEPRRACRPSSPRGGGPSPWKSTSRPASPASSCPTTASTSSRARPTPDGSAGGPDHPGRRAGAGLGPDHDPARGQVDHRPHRDPGPDPRAGRHPGHGTLARPVVAVAAGAARPRYGEAGRPADAPHRQAGRREAGAGPVGEVRPRSRQVPTLPPPPPRQLDSRYPQGDAGPGHRGQGADGGRRGSSSPTTGST